MLMSSRGSDCEQPISKMLINTVKFTEGLLDFILTLPRFKQVLQLSTSIEHFNRAL